MSQYLTFQVESESEGSDHVANDEEEEEARRLLASILDQDLLPLAGTLAGKEKQAQGKTVCSCGRFTCGMITRYGLPVPVFTDEIEPIRSQAKRDRRALEIRAGS